MIKWWKQKSGTWSKKCREKHDGYLFTSFWSKKWREKTKRLFLAHFLTHIPFQYLTFVPADFPRSTPCLIADGKCGKADTRQSKFGTFARKVGGCSYYFKYTLNQTKPFNQKYLEINKGISFMIIILFKLLLLFLSTVCWFQSIQTNWKKNIKMKRSETILQFVKLFLSTYFSTLRIYTLYCTIFYKTF